MIKLTDEQRAIVFLDSFEKLEYKRKIDILRLFQSPKELFVGAERLENAFLNIDGGNFIRPVTAALKRREYIDEMIASSLKFCDGIITLYDEEYPEELKNTPAPPLVLYYRGNVNLLKGKAKRTAIVGSRKTLPLYLEQTRQVAEKLSAAGEIIVTGIADGADSAAIKGALKSGNLISVFAGGLDCVYPRSQVNLAEEIAAKGLVITEYPAARPPMKYTYPVRNRIIAGLSRACLIVSGEHGGGARYTASYAADYGRDVMAFPYGIGAVSGELCNSLIRQGAALVETADDVADLLGITVGATEKPELDGNEKTVYETLLSGVVNADKIIENTGLKPYEVNVALSLLELKKLIVRSGTDYDIIKK